MDKCLLQQSPPPSHTHTHTHQSDATVPGPLASSLEPDPLGLSLDQVSGAEQHRSEVILELVVLSQVDPAKDERGEG